MLVLVLVIVIVIVIEDKEQRGLASSERIFVRRKKTMLGGMVSSYFDNEYDYEHEHGGRHVSVQGLARGDALHDVSNG
jgi:hypothetical protein